MKKSVTYTTNPAITPPATAFSFTLLDLYAAMARSSVRAALTPQEAWLEAQSALLRYDRHLQPVSDLRLNQRFYSSYKDSEVTNLSGRLGDALGLLVLDQMGYSRFVHFEDLQGLTPTVSNRPDYIYFDDFLSEAVLVECKGSTARKDASGLKRNLKKAVTAQIEPSLGLAITIPKMPNVTVQKGYAVGIRVTDTTNWLYREEVNPDPPTIPSSATLQVSAIHYTRWLKLMGIPLTPTGLPSGGFLPQERLGFLSTSIGGLEFCFLLDPKFYLNPRFYLIPTLLLEFPLARFGFPWFGGFPPFLLAQLDQQPGLILFGLERGILLRILQYARSGTDQENSLDLILADAVSGELRQRLRSIALAEQEADIARFSVFGDGAIALLLTEGNGLGGLGFSEIEL